MHAPFFEKITIIGVGLIGASLALAAREKGICGEIHGSGRTEENLARAKERGILDGYSLDPRKAAEGADLIVLATPVGIFTDIIVAIKGALRSGAVVTDVGSVKGGLVYALESSLPGGVHYIGAHPIAGSDRSGIGDARQDLFKNARCIVTPTGRSDKDARERIVSLWESVGAQVEIMDPFRHDEIYAAVSHLPHLLAYALVNTVDDLDPEYIRYAGQGFKDATRIALSSPEMWRDISLENRDNLSRTIKLLRENLDRMESLLNSSDGRGIEKEFSRAQSLRKKYE